MRMCCVNQKNKHPPASREATQPAIETRSEFRYKIDTARRSRPEPDDRGLCHPTSPIARQRHGLGERARPRGHQHAPPRAELKKNAAAGRWNFRHVGREAHPTAPEGGRAPRDHAQKAQYFKIPRISRGYTTRSQFGQRRTHVALPLLALIHSPRKKLPSLNGCGTVNTRPF